MTVTPRFITGSPMRHVAVMAASGAIGLTAVFAVELINLVYVSMLGDQVFTAAMGFAGVINFFILSLLIGLMIGVTATVSRTIGAQRMDEARVLATSSLVLVIGIVVLVAGLTMVFVEPLLIQLGARDRVLALAQRYLIIALPATVFLGAGMVCSALLRSVGDARRAMMVTLLPAILTAIIDPLFIFTFKLGFDGAAIVVLIARITLFGIGLHGVWRVHHLLARFDSSRLARDARLLSIVAVPAVITNLATPIGAAFVTHTIAAFGASAVAGQATIERLTPVAFGLIHSLSGAVGPVFAQNLGAKRFDRVRESLRASLIFMVLAVGVAWLVIAVLQDPLTRFFSLDGQGAQMMHAFCSWLSASFFFMGALFVANSAFNNLGRPLWSTGFNWARATLGTIPFAWWGSHYGPVEVLAGQAIGAVIFGTLALASAFWLTNTLGEQRP